MKPKHCFLPLTIVMIVIVAGFILRGDTLANPVCETVEECKTMQYDLESQIRVLRMQVKSVTARIDFLSCESGQKRKTQGGVIFTCDRSHPQFAQFGASLRDPSGLIWGSLVAYENYQPAIKYCHSIGARLPTVQEFTRLREYLGARPGTHEGYFHHFDTVLPKLMGYRYWAKDCISGYGDDYCGNAYIFYGDDGKIGRHQTDDPLPFRCVVGL